MTRIFYYDNIKGLLILCVVLWHTINICSTYYGFNPSLLKIISFFMIPLFLFITGKFAKKSRKTPLKRALKMFKLFIIMQVLVTIYYAYVLNIISPDKSLFVPRFTLWYLLTCGCLYLSEYIFRNHKFKTVFIISLIIALGSGFISQITNFLSLTRTITAVPFFVLGYYSEEIKAVEFAKKYKNIIFVLVSIITVWFLFNQDFFLLKDTYLKYSYFVYDSPLACFFKRCLLYIIFFIFSMFILDIMPEKKTPLANLGSKTLMLYLFHGVVLKTMMAFCLFIDNPIIGTILTYFLTIVISMLLDYLLSRIKKLGEIGFSKIKIKFSKEQLQPVENI